MLTLWIDQYTNKSSKQITLKNKLITIVYINQSAKKKAYFVDTIIIKFGDKLIGE